MSRQTMTAALEELERTDPAVKAARVNYDRVVEKILDTPPFQDENVANWHDLMLKVGKYFGAGAKESIELTAAEVRRLILQSWFLRQTEKDEWEARCVLRSLLSDEDLECRWTPPCKDETPERRKTRGDDERGCYRCRARVVLKLDNPIPT